MRPAPTVKPARTTNILVMKTPFVRCIVRLRAPGRIRSNRDACCSLSVESLRVSAERLPALERAARGRLRDANACVDSDIACRLCDHGVEVELCDVRKVLGEPGEPVQELDERLRLRRR